MKIKRLEIYNIASIEHETIDFDQAPLSTTDVYLITGETGAGKTTILDAICLALYATTPRLNSADTGKVADNNDELSRNNPCRLMRRNTGEASVKLTFEGIDGKVYRAEWHVQRGKNKKPGSSLTAPNWSVTDVETGEQLQCEGVRGNKLLEVRNRIVQVVGLKFDEFCRTTMLAQGEFTRFLKSTEDEKTAILEKITNLTKFRVIGQRLFTTIEEKKKAWEEAKAKAQYEGLKPEELDALRAGMEQLMRDIESLKTEKKGLEERGAWLTEWEKLEKNLLQAESDLHSATERVESDLHKSKAVIISKHDETREVRNWLNAKRQNDEEIEKQTNILSRMEADYMLLLQGIMEERVTLDGIVKDIETLRTYLNENQKNAEVFEHAEVLATQLKQIGTGRDNIVKNEQEKQKKQRLLDEVLTQTLTVAQQILLKAQEEYEKDRQVIEVKQQDLEAKGLPILHAEDEQATTLLASIDLAKRSLESLDKDRKEWNDKEIELKQEFTHIEEMKHRLSTLTDPLAKAEGAMKAKRESMDKLELSVKEWTRELRAELKIGDTCPVCGQTIHSELMQEAFDSLYQQARTDYIAAETAHRDMLTEYEGLKQSISAEEKSYNAEKVRHERDNRVTDDERKLAEDCDKCGIDYKSEDLEEQLTKLKETILQRQQMLKRKIEEAHSLDNELKRLRSAHQQLHDRIERQLKPDQEKASNDKNCCEREISTITSAIETTRQTLNEAEREVESWLPRAKWDEKPEEYGKYLREEASQYAQNLQRMRELEVKADQLRDIIEDTERERKAITDRMADWKLLSVTTGRKMNNIKDESRRLKENVIYCHSLLLKARKDAENNALKVNEFNMLHPTYCIEELQLLNTYTDKMIAQYRTEIEKDLSDKKSMEALRTKAEEDRSKHHEKRPSSLLDSDTTTELNEQALAIESSIGQKQQELGEQTKVLKDDEQKKKELAVLLTKVEEAEHVYNAWNSLKDLADKEGRNFARIAMSFIFDGLLASANEYLKRLEPRYRLRSVPDTLYIALEDGYQGFATRGTDSLSGGESFLVSLALALALADVGQQLSVDNLFIDEGFGSLSGAPLTHAINTLRSLHSRSGRHVGIISHIEEVKNNIPVQIQVKQNGGTSSSTIEIVG